LKIGLLAGYGELTVNAVSNLKKIGYEVIVLAFNEEINQDLSPYADKLYTVSVGQLRKILKILEKEKISQVAFIGKINKTLLYSNLKLDFMAIKELLKLKNRNDDTIMNAVVDLFAEKGIIVMKQTEMLKDLLISERFLSKKKPTKTQWEDIKYGYEMAKKIAGLDIGQTIVVKNQAVMSVEAIEGTDKAIERGCMLAKNGAVAVKVAKPNQDERFDVPTVGVDTLKKLFDNNGKVLAIEAGKTFVVNPEECIEYANKKSLVFVSYEGEL
jgi:DUF1009 family protein